MDELGELVRELQGRAADKLGGLGTQAAKVAPALLDALADRDAEFRKTYSPFRPATTGVRTRTRPLAVRAAAR